MYIFIYIFNAYFLNMFLQIFLTCIFYVYFLCVFVKENKNNPLTNRTKKVNAEDSFAVSMERRVERANNIIYLTCFPTHLSLSWSLDCVCEEAVSTGDTVISWHENSGIVLQVGYITLFLFITMRLFGFILKTLKKIPISTSKNFLVLTFSQTSYSALNTQRQVLNLKSPEQGFKSEISGPGDILLYLTSEPPGIAYGLFLWLYLINQLQLHYNSYINNTFQV